MPTDRARRGRAMARAMMPSPGVIRTGLLLSLPTAIVGNRDTVSTTRLGGAPTRLRLCTNRSQVPKFS